MGLDRYLTKGSLSKSTAVKGQDVSAALGRVRRVVAQFAALDWLVIAYIAILFAAVWIAPDSTERTMNTRRLAGLGSAFIVCLVAVRSGLVGNGVVAALLYRLCLFSTVFLSYFMLQGLLPVVNHRVFDAELYALDMFLFRFEPTIVMDRFVASSTTEWFAFFYYSYFFLLSAYVLPMLFFARRTHLLSDFCLAFAGIYCIGHVLYMLVPGYGPFKHLADEFMNPLPLGFWYERVLEAVTSAGAQKDIFPSLHTGGPLTCFLFAFRHRRLSPYKYVWIPTAFFAANIIIATMFLRWHYIIDIIAGIALSILVTVFASRLSTWEGERRQKRKLQPAWIPLWTASLSSGSKPAV